MKLNQFHGNTWIQFTEVYVSWLPLRLTVSIAYFTNSVILRMSDTFFEEINSFSSRQSHLHRMDSVPIPFLLTKKNCNLLKIHHFLFHWFFFVRIRKESFAIKSIQAYHTKNPYFDEAIQMKKWQIINIYWLRRTQKSTKNAVSIGLRVLLNEIIYIYIQNTLIYIYFNKKKTNFKRKHNKKYIREIKNIAEYIIALIKF